MRDTNVIIEQLYPFVKNALAKNSKKFLANIADFINEKYEQLFAIAPYENIFFNKKDLDKMYKALGFTEEEVLPMLQNIFYWNKNYNPGCAKEPYVLILLCCIRYYLKNNERKNAELTTIYLCFSGKFYASLYGMEWKYSPKNSKQIMDFVVNNMLSDKFDLKKEGSIFGAIKKLVITYLDTYKSDLCSELSDDDSGKLIQQLRDRVKSFLKNIASLFYEAYKNKQYLNYETDSVSQDDFHLTDNDSAKAARITESAINIITSQKVDLKICNIAMDYAQQSLKDDSGSKKKYIIKNATEIKDIMEAIIGDNNNIPLIRRVINIFICDFLATYKNGRVGSPDFINYSLQAKPNTKSPIMIEMKNIIYNWLDENSDNYRRRKTRAATANIYYKIVLGYFVFTVCKVAE